jgi:hypothetical protein
MLEPAWKLAARAMELVAFSGVLCGGESGVAWTASVSADGFCVLALLDLFSFASTALSSTSPLMQPTRSCTTDVMAVSRAIGDISCPPSEPPSDVLPSRTSLYSDGSSSTSMPSGVHTQIPLHRCVLGPQYRDGGRLHVLMWLVAASLLTSPGQAVRQ